MIQRRVDPCLERAGDHPSADGVRFAFFVHGDDPEVALLLEGLGDENAAGLEEVEKTVGDLLFLEAPLGVNFGKCGNQKPFLPCSA